MTAPRLRAVVVAGFALLSWALAQTSPVAAAVAPPLGGTQNYVVLGTNSIPTSGTVTCTTSTIIGDVGTTFGSITNTGCNIVGTIDAPVAAGVVSDFATAYAAIDSLNPICDGVIPITSTVLPPGTYCSAAATTIGAGQILTLNGSATDVWVFRVGTSGFGGFTGNSFQVVMAGGASACNVYWRTAEALTLTSSNFLGNVLSGSAITMTSGSWFGRALATTDVALTSATPMAGCDGSGSVLEIPTLSPWGVLALVGILAALGWIAIRRVAS